MQSHGEVGTLGPDGPFVSIAVLCERVELDRATGLSLIGIMDEVRIPRALLSQPNAAVTKQLFVAFRAGPGLGETSYQARIVTREMNGAVASEHTTVLPFGAGQISSRLEGPFSFPLRERGAYWVEIWLDDRLATRIPFRMVIEP